MNIGFQMEDYCQVKQWQNPHRTNNFLTNEG